MFLLLISLFSQIYAGEFNCKVLYKAGYPDFRFPEGLECKLSKKAEISGVSFESYHYVKDFPKYTGDDKFDHLALAVFVDVYNKLVVLNPTLSKKLYFTGLTFILSDHLPESTEVAKVRIGHSDTGENCPIIVYAKALAKENEAQKKQMLAHEIFHCVQDTIWREKKLGVDNKVDSWWTEGSAVWFSNLIYPTNAQENDYNFDYKGEFALTDQEVPYATHAFFQSFSQGYLGINGVIDFIDGMPNSGGKEEQLSAVLKFPSFHLHFHNFAEQLTSNKVKDFDSSFMLTNLASEPIKIKITEGENNLDWEMKPLNIELREVELPAKSIISLTHKTEGEAKSISFRANSSSAWDLLFKDYPTTIDLSCKSHNKTVELLSTLASDDSDKKFSMQVLSKKSECKCIDKEKFDPCLYGEYEIDPRSIDAMFEKIFKDRFTVEKSSGEYQLVIDTLQQFHFKLTAFSASVILHDEDMGDIRNQVTITGTTKANAKIPELKSLCFSDVSDDMNIHFKIEMPYGTVEHDLPYNQFEDFSSGQLKYQCNKDELIFLRQLPTGEGGEREVIPIRFFRKSSPL